MGQGRLTRGHSHTDYYKELAFSDLCDEFLLQALLTASLVNDWLKPKKK